MGITCDETVAEWYVLMKHRWLLQPANARCNSLLI